MTSPLAIQPRKAWAVLVYMAGDNNLEPFAYADLAEMHRLPSDQGVHVASASPELFLARRGEVVWSSPIKGTADFARWMATLAREVNPIVTIPGGSSGDPMKTVHEEIAAIETFMQKDRKAYNADPSKAARLMQLYDIRKQMERKAG